MKKGIVFVVFAFTAMLAAAQVPAATSAWEPQPSSPPTGKSPTDVVHQDSTHHTAGQEVIEIMTTNAFEGSRIVVAPLAKTKPSATVPQAVPAEPKTPTACSSKTDDKTIDADQKRP